MAAEAGGGNSPPDDFELLPEENFEAMLSSLLRVNGTATTTTTDNSNSPNRSGNGYSIVNAESGASDGDDGSMKMLEVFEVVRKEQKLLKEELVSQSITLRERLEALEERDRKKAQEIASLKNELDATKLSLHEKEIREVELERQLKYFKECSEQVDALTAQYIESEDIIKQQNRIIEQFQSDGFVSVQPPMLTDHLLAKEMSRKDEHVKRLETALSNVESESLKAQEENREMKETVNELRGFVTALQSQAELDKAEWEATRDEMTQQITELVERLSVLDPEFVASQIHRTTNTTITQQAPLLTQPSTIVEASNRTCPRCHLRIASVDMLSHHPCPGVIDGLD